MIADYEADESRNAEETEESSLLGSADISNKGMFVLLLYDKAIKCMTESIQLIDEGKITEYEAELKLESILSGGKIGKKRGIFDR